MVVSRERMWRFLTLLLCLSYALAGHEIYDGHALFSVKIKNVDEALYFNSLGDPLDIWVYATQARDGMVLVPKDNIQQFKADLSSRGMEYEMKIENIRESLELEEKLLAEKARSRVVESDDDDRPVVSYDEIYNLTQVYDYITKVANAYPDVATLVNGGKSFEGRDVKYLTISNSKFENTSKPIIFIETLIHSREWVTLPVSLYAIDKLVVNVTDQDLLDNFDWIILPVANPDGFEFTHNSQSRLWRKNRRTGLLPDDRCEGVDLNRNFDIFYSLGSSNDVCSEIYHGTSAFSEPETRIIRDILRKYEGRIEMFLDVHSFGSMILYGWGSGELPSNVLDLHATGLRMAEAIDAVKREYNRNYVVGNAALVLYHASGLALDYASVAGVPLSYAYELPGHRNYPGSILGFLVHPDFIEQAGFETWEGIKAGARYALSIRNVHH